MARWGKLPTRSFCLKSHVSQFYINCFMCPFCCWTTHPRRRRHWPMARLTYPTQWQSLASPGWLSWIVIINRPSVEEFWKSVNNLIFGEIIRCTKMVPFLAHSVDYPNIDYFFIKIYSCLSQFCCTRAVSDEKLHCPVYFFNPNRHGFCPSPSSIAFWNVLRMKQSLKKISLLSASIL